MCDLSKIENFARQKVKLCTNDERRAPKAMAPCPYELIFGLAHQVLLFKPNFSSEFATFKSWGEHLERFGPGHTARSFESGVSWK